MPVVSTVTLTAALALAGAPEPEAPLTLTLAEALELALVRNHALAQARIGVEDAKQQSRLAWSGVMPRLDGRIGYTRTVLAANPFAGSGAGNSFASLGAVDWLRFNEEARTDGDAATGPITFADYQARQNAALASAGVTPDPDRNPFLVENQFAFGVGLTQVLYDEAVFAGLEAAEITEKAAEVGIRVENLVVVRDVSTSFYGGLLAQAQTEILAQSVARAKANEDETRARVEQGTLPEFQLTTAEVERANLETALARAEAVAATAVDAVRLAIGLGPEQPLVLSGALDPAAVGARPASLEAAVASAYEKRPDLRRVQLDVDALEVSVRSARAGYLPRVVAVADLAYNGAIPDDRSFTVSANDPNDPFAVQKQNNGVFADPYWFGTFNLGVQLQWNLFEGFATAARSERQVLAAKSARVGLERARLQVRLEVERSLRDLDTARRQIDTQGKIRERAQTNYEQVRVRVREGISTQFDLRQASEQLDDSRFNYLQAVHDYLVAHVGYQVAIGTPPQP